MAFEHGLYVRELSTNLTPLSSVTSPNVVIGTAPIHLAQNPAAANVPVLCNSIAEFTEQFGFSDDFSSYTLCEAAQAHYQLFNVTPVIFVNVLDPTRHSKNGTKEVTGLSNAVEVDAPIILSTLKVTSGTSTTPLVADEDYTAAYDSSGKVVFTVLNQSKITGDKATLSYKEVDATAITASDIIGGYDTTTGKNSGLECVEEIFSRFRMIPNSIIAPKWSTNAAVAAVMTAKAKSVNGCFKALAIVDMDTTTTRKYTDVGTAKTLADNFAVVCWPKVSLGGREYHLSSQIAALMNLVDANHGGLPYKSPSNEGLQMDKACLEDGTDIFLSRDQANVLNSIGVVTALNWSSGWVSWGNSCSSHPANPDPLGFIACRRMMNYLVNTLITTYWAKIDEPITRRLVLGVLDSVNQWLNGLVAAGAILGGRCQFLDSDNTPQSLAAGKLIFHLSVGFLVPAQSIELDVEFDASYLETLFAA